MKNLLVIIMTLVVIQGAFGQCSSFYNFKEGAEYEMTHYNKKDKKTGKTVTRIVSLEEKNGEIIATVQGIAYDKKDKEITQMQYEYRCDDGTLKMDLSTYIPREQFEKNPNIEFEMSGDFLEFPSELEEGQKLPDGSITGKMIMSDSGPMNAMDMQIDIKNRRVEGMEDITTSLGSFECYKLTYDMASSTRMMGMNITNEGGGIDYLAKGLGVVRSESYDKKGKLRGYTLLTDYTD